MGSNQIMLDPSIRDWVLIPIVLIMFLMGILRNNVTKMLRKDVPPNVTQVRGLPQFLSARGWASLWDTPPPEPPPVKPRGIPRKQPTPLTPLRPSLRSRVTRALRCSRTTS